MWSCRSDRSLILRAPGCATLACTPAATCARSSTMSAPLAYASSAVLLLVQVIPQPRKHMHPGRPSASIPAPSSSSRLTRRADHAPTLRATSHSYAPAPLARAVLSAASRALRTRRCVVPLHAPCPLILVVSPGQAWQLDVCAVGPAALNMSSDNLHLGGVRQPERQVRAWPRLPC